MIFRLVSCAVTGLTMDNVGAIDYWALASALGGVLTFALTIWIAIAGRAEALRLLTPSLAHDRASAK